MDMTNATTIVSKNESKNCPTDANAEAAFSVPVNLCSSTSYIKAGIQIKLITLRLYNFYGGLTKQCLIIYRYGGSNPGLQDENLLS